MTLEQFKKNLELINQIESTKTQNKNSISENNIIQKNINSPSNMTAPYSNEYIKNNQKQNMFQKAGKWFGNIFQSAKNWEDGYDFGDVTKTIIGSTADAGLNAYNAVASMMEGISKLGGLGIAQVADWAGNDKFADAMRKEISDANNDAYLTPKVNAFREKYIEPNSIFGTSADQVASGVGSTIGASALSVLGGANIGKLHDVPVGMGVAEMGNSVAENYSKKDVTDAQAWLNGAGKGIVSALSESIFGAFGVGGSELDDVLVKKATSHLNSQLAKGIAQLGIKAGGEATEEFLEYAGGYLTNLATDMISQGKGAEFYQKWDSDEVLQNMLSAFISTGITQSSGTVSNLIKGNDVITGNTKQVQAQIDQEVQSQIQALQEKGEKVSTAKQLEIERGATEKIYLNKAKQELIDVVNKSENIDKSMKSGILSKIDSTEDFNNLNVISKMINSYDNINKQLALAQNNKLNVPVEKDIVKQAFIDSAKLNNIDVNNNTEVLDSMFEMAYQRGVNISIDGKAFSNQNQDALWRINKETGQREVVINPNNPQKALQSITIHELTHDMENTEAYDELSKVVLDYAKKQNNYDNAFKELSDMYAEEYKNYKGNEFSSRIEQEMVADILGEKLGNQEFVNHIVNTNNSVARNIYNWVVDKLNKVNKLTGYKFEKLYWADVKNKFDKAFNSEFNNIDGETKYHISSNLSENIDIVLNNINERNPVRLRDYTPSILVKNGIKDLPMYENASHIRKNIFTEAEAIQKGLSVGKRDHYHGLGKEIYIKAIDSLDNPRVIFKNNKNNEYLILTVVKDNKGNNIVVPIEIETTTNLNKVKLDINRVKTVYGYEKINNIGLNDYIKHNIKNSKMTKIYEQKKEQGTGFSTVANSFLNNIIPQSQQNINNETLTDENIKKYILPEIEDRYKNESKEKITETLEELKSQKSKIDIETDEGWDKNFEINQKIKAIENGYDNIYEFLVNHDLNELRTEEIIDKNEKKKALEEKQIKLQREIEEATPFKRAQYELIQKTNPMFDEEHVGIRSPKDIKTFEECIRDADEDSVFVWGDYTKEDAIRDLKRNKVRVYSSYAIKNGVFVSTSYRQALDYAGNDPTKVHSKEVNPSRIAWINGDEGQYASVSIAPTSSFFETKTDNKGRQLSTQQQEYFKDSKVRDENGNLIEVYHASKNKFTKFDKSKIRTGITLYSNNGDGFYFTDSKGMIDDYIQNGEVYSVYLNITKPFTVENNLSDEAKNVLVDFSKQTYYNHQEEESKKRFGRYEIFDADDIGQISGSAILSRVVSAYGDEFTQFLKDKGYDGIKASVTDYHNTGSKYDYIAFEPNQIKNVDNVNPTASDDIRYSKSNNGAYQKFLKDNFSNDGTKTYMKDIKLPSKISNLKNELRNIVDTSTDMDSGMKDSLQKLINDASTEAELQSYKEDLKPNTETQKAPVKSGIIKITNYKNAKLNSKIVNNALSMTEANKQGRRTKSQWLQVAEQIGMNIKESEIDKYAYKTWSDLLPNQKNNLNRQGEKYVKFTRDEWIKAVNDGYYKANVEVEGITREESQNIEKVIEDKNITKKSSDELWNELVNNSSEEAQELLDGRNIEVKQGRKNTKVISNDKSIEISKSGNMYLNNSKPTAEQFRNGLENHFEKGEKRLAPVNNKQVQEGYNVEEWTGNEWKKSDSKAIKDDGKNFLDEESPTLKYLKEARNGDKASFSEVSDYLMQKFVNRGHYIDKLAKQTNNQELKFAYDKTLSTFAEAQYSIGIAQTDSKGNEIGKSLIDIFKPVKEAGLSNEFNDYLLNRLNIERQAVEKSVFGPEITSETSRNNIRKYEKKYPQFKEWANDVYKYNNNELQNLVDAGFISKDTQELFHSMYGDYVPIHRILEETVDKASKTTKETGATSPIKRAKGGYQEILDIETSMAENVLSSKKAIRMNELGIELAKSTGNASILEEIGYQPKWTPDAIVSLNGDVVLNEDGKYLYTIYTNGEMKQFRLTEELYEGLRKDTIDSKIRNNKILNTLLTPVEKLTKAQRDLLTTYSVGFALNNPIKDFQDGLFYTKYSTWTFLKNYTVALQEIAKKGEYYKKYMALGGMDNSYFDYDAGIKTEAKGVKKLFKKIQKINGILETAPRLAEYISSIENGATQNEAMYNASDITTNFKRGGEITKVANKYGANFLNASVQGLDKFVRTFTNLDVKSGLKLITRVASMGILPTLLNSLLYKDDDDYEKLEDYIKDEYYLIKISDDGDFIRIPKGRVLATISSATRTMIDGVKEGELDLKGFKDEAIKQLAPNNPLEDNLLAPVMQVARNKTWYGTDLVPTRLQNQLPKNQYNEKTDKISLWLGENLNISPIKINYLIDQYSGGIGDVILPMLTPQAENNIITDKFTTNSISKNKTVGEFYDALDKYEKLKNDSNASEEEKTKYSYLSKVSSKVGKLYGMKREIQMDSSLTDKEKKELVKEIQKEINAYTECAMDNINGEYTTENKWNMYVDGIISDKVRESDGNSALQDALYIINNSIATKEEYMDMYQLSKDNDLSIPTMKTLVKLKNNKVKLTSYTDFKIGTKDYKSDRDEDDKAISGSLSAKKATYIMDMDISKEQKNGLLNVLSEGASYDDLKKLKGNYTTYFQQNGEASKTGGLSAREKYMSLVNAGISVDELNTFYEQIGNISAIKDENGKTISGSKKQLVFNFINSLKLSIPQKMILLAKQYNSFGKQYIKEILDYISSSKMSKKEKIKLIYMLYKS